MTLVDQLRSHAGAPEGPPTEEELARPYAAPTGEQALLPAGVIYSADWKKFADGMARHARAQVSALAGAGVPVVLQSISSEGMFLDSDVRPEVRAEVGHLAALTLGRALVAIRQAVFHNADFTRNVVIPNGGRLATEAHEDAIYASTILYTSLERDAVAPVLVDIFRRCAEVWVPCHHNAHALINSGMPEYKVQVIPFPYDPASQVCRIPAPRGSERVPEGKRFYSIGKWEPRKDHATLLRAFLCAYGPKDKASLTLKVHGWGEWDGYPNIEQALRMCGEDARVRANGWTDENLRKRVRVLVDKVSDEEIVELHRQNNIYVSASHGEAWDIPAFEAKCAGNALVHVGYGGSADYAAASDRGDVWIPHRMGPVPKVYGWEDSRWAEYWFEDLVQALKRAAPPRRRVHPRDFNNRFSSHAVGEKMAERILRVLAPLHESPSRDMLASLGSYA